MATEAHNADPDPDEMPVGAPGAGSGSVEPGDTPPGESSVSAVQGHGEDAPARWTQWAWLGGIGVVVLVGALAFLGYGLGLLD
jgi:hypothetical protein